MMARYPDGYFDLAIVDPPYGTMHCAWDDAANLEKWLAEIYRVLKPDGTLICFGQQPMFSRVVTFMGKRFSHEVIWEKTQKGGFLNANRMPLRAHENIAISKVEQAVYYNSGKPDVQNAKKKRNNSPSPHKHKGQYGKCNDVPSGIVGFDHPTSVVTVSNWNGAIFGDNANASQHPTQKPVDIYKWLLKHYARPNAHVLDCFLGSGSIAIACHDYGYDLTACELDPDYYAAAMKRIANHTAQQRLFT